MMNSTVHIYSAPSQPMTRFVDDCSGKRFVMRNNPRRQMRCHLCGRRRWAKNLRVHVYYDYILVCCADRERYRGNFRCKP